jgi:acyl-CoA synthetase (AMP-forming)/AMP-acid ligase II
LELKRAFRDELRVVLVENYGQSELGGFVALGKPFWEDDERLAAIGPALPDKEVRIVDEHEREVPTGDPGEMVLRGGFMAGYWNMPDKTSETLRNGWLHTGDMGRMDSEGYIHMLGRWSERIVTSGRVIYPRNMEEALYRHPAVHYVAVIGKADASAGEVAKAVVELYGGKPATTDELMRHCHDYLGAERSPQVIEIIEKMPMTPTGKIGRADLQQREKALRACFKRWVESPHEPAAKLSERSE